MRVRWGFGHSYRKVNGVAKVRTGDGGGLIEERTRWTHVGQGGGSSSIIDTTFPNMCLSRSRFRNLFVDDRVVCLVCWRD
jgi:hypothetical protein